MKLARALDSADWLTDRRAVLLAALGLSALHLAFVPAFELFPQEAYYALYARYPALSYFDHPPLIGWALWLATHLLGESVLALRLCAFTLTAGTQVLVWKLVALVLPEERRGPGALLLLTPLLAVVSLISSPDVPLLLCWTAALLALWTALQRGGGWWLLAGGLSGLAFDAKYTALYLPVGAALTCVATPEGRRWARTPWPYLGLLLLAAAAAPALVWNATHGMASLRFQTVERATAAGFHPRFAAALLGTQAVLIGPAALWVLARVPAARLRETPALFLAAFSLPPIAAALVASLFIQIKPNWLYPAYVAGLPLAALVCARPRALVLRTAAWSLAVQLLAAAEVSLGAVRISSLDTCFGWRALAEQVERLRPPGAFLFADPTYKIAAELEFYTGGKVYAGNILGRRALQYDYLGDDLGALRGQDALFVTTPGVSEAEALAARFDEVRELSPLSVPAGGKTSRAFRVWLCRGYRGPG